MLIISKATENDIQAIIQIAEKTWWPTYLPCLSPGQIRFMLDTIYAPEVLKQEIITGSQTFILLHDEKEPQGFAAFGVWNEDPNIYKLHKIYVLPENQGKGYGKFLMDEVKDEMLKKNIFTLDLNVNRCNPARTFYEKMGFQVLRREDIPIGPYWMNDFVMRLQLHG